ncbi:hypothetical protein PI126_g21428 [Phytophthora idaei]|nr:hypothetical protein PI126_g21428 [Phytophthora idaei]
MLPLDEIDAQYERIVRLIPVDEFQGSYNSVLQDEISSVSHAVNDIAAALSRLEDVRDAVSKLQQDNPQRSLSLLKTMDRTLELQHELGVRLQKVTQLTGVTSINKKRQRNEQVERIAHTQRDNEESESESSSESSSDSSESSGESEEEAIAVDPRRRFLLQQTREDEKNDGDCSGGLFPGRSTLISDLEMENIAGARPSRRLNLLPPTNSREKSSRVVNKTDSGGQSNVVTVAKTSKQYMNMVEKVDRMSAVERYSHICEVLEEMTRVVNNFGRARLQEQEAQIIMEYVLRWLWDCTDQRDLLDVYQSFLTAMVAYEKQAELKETSMLKGLNTKFSRILEQLESSKGEPTGSNLEKSKSKHGKSMPSEEPSNAHDRCEGFSTERTPVQSSKPPTVATSKNCPPVVKAAGAPQSNDKFPAYYTAMFNNVKQVPMEHRALCISHALLQLKKFPETEELQRITDQFSETIDKIRSEASSTHAVKPVPQHADSKYLDAQKGSAITAIAQGHTQQGEGCASSVLGGNGAKKYETEESDSDSESDYEDEKDAIGGSEAAWNALMGTATFDKI